MSQPSMETFVSLCKRRGFVFQSPVILSDDHSRARDHASPRRNLSGAEGDKLVTLLSAAREGCP